MIAISKIEEFASVLDDSVDTASLEKLPFVQRIPIGMYVFAYLEESGIDYSYQVMVYDSTRKAYEDMMLALPGLFESFGCIDEYPAYELLEEMAAHCRDTFFLGEMIPPYEEKDIIRILKYYAQYETPPQFYSFDDIDRSRLDVSAIAVRMGWDPVFITTNSPLGMDFSSSGVISARSAIWRDWLFSPLLRLMEPDCTV